MTHTKKRSDNEWVEALKGLLGPDEQTSAILELANYLYVVASKNLQRRRYTVLALKHRSYDEMGMLAEEFVQAYMEKMIKDDFAILDKYSGHGSFLGWASQVTTHLCNSELRKKSWHTNEPLEAKHTQIKGHIAQPEAAALRGELSELIGYCINQLPQRNQVAITRCIMEGESASKVGEFLGISANAVHLLVFRGKKMLRKHLERAGIGADSLATFAYA